MGQSVPPCPARDVLARGPAGGVASALTLSPLPGGRPVPHVSPIRLLRHSRLWMPAAALGFALLVLAVSWTTARSAHQFETRGALAEATVLARETRTEHDSDGNSRTSYHLAYEFHPAEGPAIRMRREVSYSFYSAVTEGDRFTLRYLPDRPRRHELRPGETRTEAEQLRLVGLGALAFTLAMAAWLGLAALPMLRAVAGRQSRRATVTAHVLRPGRRLETGGRYGRIRWRDETGAEGESGLVPMLEVASHPVGTPIRVIIDPGTGRSWWEEELIDPG